MTRWMTLQASRPHKPTPWDLAAPHRRLSAPTLATCPGRAPESGAEPCSRRSPQGPQPCLLPASWPRRKQHPPLQHQTSAPQSHGEVVSWSICGGTVAEWAQVSVQSWRSLEGDFVLDASGLDLNFPTVGCMAWWGWRALNFSGPLFRE